MDGGAGECGCLGQVGKRKWTAAKRLQQQHAAVENPDSTWLQIRAIVVHTVILASHYVRFNFKSFTL